MKPKISRHARRPPWATLVLLALASLACGAWFGVASLDWSRILQWDSPDARIFWDLRVARVCVAFLTGAGLAVGGLVFQSLFLNALATPYTLGVSSGASCGAAVVIYLAGLPAAYLGPSVVAGSWMGALTAVALILGFSRSRFGNERHALLLAGVAVSFFFSSLLLLVQFLASFYQSFQIVRWLMGGLAVAGFREVWVLLPVLLLVSLLVAFHVRHLDLLLLGDELALTRGLEVRRTKAILIGAVSLMVATVVSIAGPIGFVGMVVPHVCRMLWGSRHGRLLPLCLLLGGTALTLCDLGSRLILAPSGIPVGVLTSLIGAPFFFYLLLSRSYKF